MRSTEVKGVESPETAGRERIPPELRIEDPGGVVDAGARWLREYLEEAGADRFVIGVSGGIDSSVTALWAGRAVGPERLTLLSMPCRPGPLEADLGESAVQRARTVAERLSGCDFRILDVGSTVAAEAWTCGLGGILDADRWSGEVGRIFGNLQARVRAVRLRTFANAQRGLVLGTGNLSEGMLGYFTIGGDEEWDLDLLGDLFKTHVRQIAPLLDVPDEIREAAPSADLVPDQTDEGELGFGYAAADRVLYRLRSLVEGDVVRVPASVRARLESEGVEGVEDRVVAAVLDRVEETAFKRAYAPRFRLEERDPGRS